MINALHTAAAVVFHPCKTWVSQDGYRMGDPPK